MQDIVSFDEFKKIQLAVGLVLECEKIEWSDKLYKLKVKFGEEDRIILSGLAKFYAPEELINKKFIFITNLEPKKIKDLESHGMILAGDSVEGKPVMITPIADIADGGVLH